VTGRDLTATAMTKDTTTKKIMNGVSVWKRERKKRRKIP